MAWQVSPHDAPGFQIIIRPNRSMTWREARYVWAGLGAVTLTFGAAFCWAGLTLVLPFSGAEILALGAAFYCCLRQGSITEIVVIDDRHITVEQGRTRPNCSTRFTRGWARVRLVTARGWYPSRLLLCSHGRELEIGSFLPEEERVGLAQRLRELIGQPPRSGGREDTD